MDVGLRTMILNRNMSVCGWHFTDFYSQLFHFVLLMFWTNIFFNILVLSSSLSYDWNVHIIEWCVCLRHHHRITDSNGDVLRCTNLLSMIGDLKLCTSYIVPIWLEVQHFCIWVCTWAIQFHEFQWNAYAYTHTHTHAAICWEPTHKADNKIFPPLSVFVHSIAKPLSFIWWHSLSNHCLRVHSDTGWLVKQLKYAMRLMYILRRCDEPFALFLRPST